MSGRSREAPSILRVSPAAEVGLLASKLGVELGGPCARHGSEALGQQHGKDGPVAAAGPRVAVGGPESQPVALGLSQARATCARRLGQQLGVGKVKCAVGVSLGLASLLIQVELGLARDRPGKSQRHWRPGQGATAALAPNDQLRTFT